MRLTRGGVFGRLGGEAWGKKEKGRKIGAGICRLRVASSPSCDESCDAVTLRNQVM